MDTLTKLAMEKAPLSVALFELTTMMSMGLGSPAVNVQVMVLEALNTLGGAAGFRPGRTRRRTAQGTHQKADSLGPVMVMASGCEDEFPACCQAGNGTYG